MHRASCRFMPLCGITETLSDVESVRVVHESDCGNDTDDKVYLCSYIEALAVSDDTRDCGIDWWLRTPGKYQYDAQYIGLRSPDTIGNYVDSHMAVRPAIRVRYLGQTVDR